MYFKLLINLKISYISIVFRSRKIINLLKLDEKNKSKTKLSKEPHEEVNLDIDTKQNIYVNKQ